MSDLDLKAFFTQRLVSGASEKHAHTGVYTGVLEKYEMAPDQLVLALNSKGKPVAIIADSQILPFEVITVSDSMAKGYAEDYNKNRQGRLLAIKGERPKVRS